MSQTCCIDCALLQNVLKAQTRFFLKWCDDGHRLPIDIMIMAQSLESPISFRTSKCAQSKPKKLPCDLLWNWIRFHYLHSSYPLNVVTKVPPPPWHIGKEFYCFRLWSNRYCKAYCFLIASPLNLMQFTGNLSNKCMQLWTPKEVRQ